MKPNRLIEINRLLVRKIWILTGINFNVDTKLFQVKGYFTIILIFCMLSIHQSVFGFAISDTARINSFIRSGFSHLSTKSMIDKSKLCIDSALALCKRHNLEIPAKLSLLRAQYSFATGDFRSSSDFANQSLEQAANEGDDRVHTMALVFLGNYSFRTGSFQESIDYYTKGISMAKKSGLKGIIPKTLDGEAQVYNAIGDFKNYRLCLIKMIDASIAESDTNQAARGLYLAGTLHSERLRDFTLCDSLLRKSYTFSLKSGNVYYMALSQANMGWNYYLEKMYDSSITCYNRTLKIALPSEIYSTAANAFGNLGSIYRDLNDPVRSLGFYQKSLDLATNLRDWYNLQWVYKDMSDLYLRMNDTSKAFNTYVMHKQFNDSMLIMNNAKGLADARMRYEADSHRKEVELLSLKIKNQRLMIYGYAGIFVFTIALFLLLHRGSKLKSRRRISEMNRKISELTQANLRQQMNPHFIFNTLNSIQYYMYQHDKLATNNYLTKFTSLMRRVLENSQHTSVALRDELEALNLYLELESLRFKDRFDYNITVDEEIDTMLFRIPTMLIQPYVENSICHGLMPGEGKGLLKIDLKLEKDHIACTIEDNGIGREAAQKRKKTNGINHNSLGTQIVASRLDLVNSLYGTNLQTIYTDLKSSSGEPSGTMVEIHIPIIT